MPGQRSIYVRAEDEDLWERALAYAKARRIPMSALIMSALEAYLADEEG